MGNERRLEIFGILLIALSFFLLVSQLGYNPNEEPTISPNVRPENPMGIVGIFLSHFLIKMGFGYSTIFIPLLGLSWGWFLFSKKETKKLQIATIYVLSAMLLSSITIGLLIITFSDANINYITSGLIGANLAQFFKDWLSGTGTWLFLSAAYLMLVRGYFDLDFYKPFKIVNEKCKAWYEQFLEKKIQKEKTNKKREHTEKLKKQIDEKNDLENVTNQSLSAELDSTHQKINEDNGGNDKELDNNTENQSMIFDNPNNNSNQQDQNMSTSESQQNIDKHDELIADDQKELNIEEMAKVKEIDIDKIQERKKPKRKYQLPSSDLLANPVVVSDELNRDELVERANYLTESMSTFGVQGEVDHVHPGPIITLFEVQPAEGVRVNKFVQLADDLARVMEASSVRVIAPIPGKSSVGIEIPNRNPATVYFKSIVNSPEFAKAQSLLTLAIGKTTSGEISTLDLSKMPHLLIAGTTGSGKSVCINTIICSILYRATPDEVKFVMIDPKKVEMTLYRKLEGYHLLKMEDISEPIVTTVDNAILALRALEKEMDRRYNILADALVRNIGEYNDKMIKQNESIMPYIVLVVDELADLMMLSAKDVEAPIARLAQLSRAVGIHLVIATQRPSVDVITGVIKANFPSRIAFQVASKIDSRTIIDQPGADKLIGRGDMLHLGTGSSDVFRMHNAFLTLEEIESLMNHISNQPKPEEIILPTVRESQLSEFGNDVNRSTHDELFNEAVALVVTHQQGSISLLQRRLKVGYSRAARLIDEMEQTGVVGPFTGSKAREVLVDETYLEMIKDT